MKLAVQTAVSAVFGLLFFVVLLFVPAGTWHYWQAWVFIAVFTVSTLLPTGYLAVKRPATLRRRMRAGPHAETRPVQRVVMTATLLTIVAMLVASAADHRFGWSHVPAGVVVAGNILVGVGLGLAQLVVIQNSYAAATITVESEQTLASTGLYAVVRHPMYAGALIMMAGTPPALGSYWGWLALAPAVAALVVRILDEEKMLAEQLPGYRQYCRQVRYRLVPHLW